MDAYRRRCFEQEAQLSLTNRLTLEHAMLCCKELPSGERLRFIGLIFGLLPTHFPFDAFNEGMPSSYGVYIWCWITRMAGEGRTVII